MRKRLRPRRPRPSHWAVVIAANEWAGRQVLAARLTRHRARLARTGSDNMMELLADIPVERAGHVVYGIGQKTIAALKQQGHHRAADLWDEDDREPHVPKLPMMGEARYWALVSWVRDEAQNCGAQAQANAARRAELRASIAELEAELATRAETRDEADVQDTNGDGSA
jgi:hypothetical protein